MLSLKNSRLFFILSLLSVTTVACQVKLGTNTINTTSVSSPTVNSSSAKPQTIDTLGQVEFRRILSGDKSNVRNYGIRLNEDETDFQKLWDDHAGSKTNPLFLPKVDFELKNVLAVFLGDRPTTGYSVDIEKIEETKDEITVYLKENKPSVGSAVKAEITQPFLMIEMKKTKKRLVFENSSLIKTPVENITFSNLETGYDSGIKEFSKRLAKTEKEFSDLYKEHLSAQKIINATVFPTIDFKQNMVVGIFLGERPSTGYSISVKNIEKTESQLIVTASEVPPVSSDDVTSIVTTPYQFITLPQSNLPIKFDVSLIVPEGNVDTNTNNSGNITRSTDINFKPLLNGDISNIDSSLYQLIRTKRELTDLWQRHSSSTDSIPPDVDFSNNNVIAVFMGKKPTSGFSIKINSVIETDTEIRVFVDLRKDRGITQNFSTSPFEMALIPKTSKAVSFIVNNLVN